MQGNGFRSPERVMAHRGGVAQDPGVAAPRPEESMLQLNVKKLAVLLVVVVLAVALGRFGFLLNITW
jgi:hypothetical protein